MDDDADHEPRSQSSHEATAKISQKQDQSRFAQDSLTILPPSPADLAARPSGCKCKCATGQGQAGDATTTTTTTTTSAKANRSPHPNSSTSTSASANASLPPPIPVSVPPPPQLSTSTSTSTTAAIPPPITVTVLDRSPPTSPPAAQSERPHWPSLAVGELLSMTRTSPCDAPPSQP
jgi:hypothetical protein